MEMTSLLRNKTRTWGRRIL